jgi:hypothetical protein
VLEMTPVTCTARVRAIWRRCEIAEETATLSVLSTVRTFDSTTLDDDATETDLSAEREDESAELHATAIVRANVAARATTMVEVDAIAARVLTDLVADVIDADAMAAILLIALDVETLLEEFAGRTLPTERSATDAVVDETASARAKIRAIDVASEVVEEIARVAPTERTPEVDDVELTASVCVLTVPTVGNWVSAYRPSGEAPRNMMTPYSNVWALCGRINSCSLK